MIQDNVELSSSPYSYGIVVFLLESGEWILDNLVFKGQALPLEVRKKYVISHKSFTISIALIQSKIENQDKPVVLNVSHFHSDPNGELYSMLELSKEQSAVIRFDIETDPMVFIEDSCLEMSLTIDGKTGILCAECKEIGFKKEASFNIEPDYEYPSLGIGVQSFDKDRRSTACLNFYKVGECLPTEKNLVFYTAYENMDSFRFQVYEGKSKDSAYILPADQKVFLNAVVPLPDSLPPATPVSFVFKVSKKNDLTITANVNGCDPISVIYHNTLKRIKKNSKLLFGTSNSLPFVFNMEKQRNDGTDFTELIKFKYSDDVILDEFYDAILDNNYKDDVEYTETTIPLNPKWSNIYGIDFGSTYSRIARIHSNSLKPVIVEDASRGSTEIASSIFFSEDRLIFGDSAMEAGAYEPECYCDNYKEFIGREKEYTSYFDGRVYSPEDLLSILLHEMINYASMTGEKVEDVVITCPVCFDEKQRKAIQFAGKVAGLNNIGIVDEPTAAVASYLCEYPLSDQDQVILIYDLGGKTFQLTLMKIKFRDNLLFSKIIGSKRNKNLGGIDWNERLFDVVKNQYEFDCGTIIEPNSEEEAELRSLIERVKRNLSTREKATFRMFAGRLIVTRADFETSTKDLVEQTISQMDMFLEEESYEPDSIDKVLLVGGSTRMPMIYNTLIEKFGVDRLVSIDPDGCIAKGAAIIANYQKM